MAIVRLPAPGLVTPILWHSSPWDGFAQPSLIDASGEKISAHGYVWNKDGTDGKNISKVAFVMGSGLVKGGSTDIQVSLQNIDLSTGVPDETADQTVLIGNANIASSTYIELTLGATRTVNYGELLAVVWEFSTFNASDLFRVFVDWTMRQNRFTRLAEKAGTWTLLSGIYQPNVFFGFDDGTWGTFWGTSPVSAVGTTGINTGSTPDEVALRVQVPAPLSVDGIHVWGQPADASANYDLVLYEGTTQLATVSVDNSWPTSAYHVDGAAMFDEGPQTLLPGHTYYAAIKPTTAASYNVAYYDVNAVAQWDAHALGRECYWAQRTDGGAWSTTTTRRPAIALHVSGVDVPVEAACQMGII